MISKALRHAVVTFMILAPFTPQAGSAVKLRPLTAIYLDDKGTDLKQPEAVAFDGKSLLVVADTGNGRLLKYTLAAETLTPAGEILLPEVSYPIQVQFNSRGDILALDGRRRQIARISPSGKFGGYLDLAGATGTGTIVVRNFRIDGQDNLYLLDIFQGRIHVLGPEGRSQRQIAFPRGTSYFSDLALDGRGNVFALQGPERRIYVARREENTLQPLAAAMPGEMAFPAALAVDGAGQIFIADQTGGGIVILGPDGSFRGRQAALGWKEGMLRYPSGLCISQTGILFVADRENNRVQVFSLSE